MRIIAGSAGGIPIEVPKHDLRPTMEKVRAAIFSSLGDRIPGATVLDLFSGSGAFGLEAASRGAAAVTFVDHHPGAIKAIRANLAKTRLAAQVRQADAYQFLAQNMEQFDLIFADPPYDHEPSASHGERVLRDPHLGRRLNSQGILILERRDQKVKSVPDRWIVIRAKRYGGTEVLILTPAITTPDLVR